nr:hypothetical protein [uncultured Roseateles sp.]
MKTSAILVHSSATLLFILAVVIGKPVLCVIALAMEVGYAALSDKGRK